MQKTRAQNIEIWNRVKVIRPSLKAQVLNSQSAGTLGIISIKQRVIQNHRAPCMLFHILMNVSAVKNQLTSGHPTENIIITYFEIYFGHVQQLLNLF